MWVSGLLHYKCDKPTDARCLRLRCKCEVLRTDTRWSTDSPFVGIADDEVVGLRSPLGVTDARKVYASTRVGMTSSQCEMQECQGWTRKVSAMMYARWGWTPRNHKRPFRLTLGLEHTDPPSAVGTNPATRPIPTVVT